MSFRVIVSTLFLFSIDVDVVILKSSLLWPMMCVNKFYWLFQFNNNWSFQTCSHCCLSMYYTAWIFSQTYESWSGNSQPKRKLRRIYVCSLSLDKVLLVNSSTLNGENISWFMIQIGTGDWLFCELWTIVISIWNNHRWAERIEKREKDWPWECPSTKRGSVAVNPRSLRA